MAIKTVKLKLKSSNIPSNQTSEVKKNLEVIHDYSELWENYDESNIKISLPSGDIEANKELKFTCQLDNLPIEIENLANNNNLHYVYDWSLTQSNSISDSTVKSPTIIFSQGEESVLVKVTVTCYSDIGNFKFVKKTSSKFITVKDDIPAIWDKWKIDSSNSSDGVIKITQNGNRVSKIESLNTYKLIFDIIRIPDEISQNNDISYYWETDGYSVLSSNRDAEPTITWDKVDKKESKSVNLRLEYDNSSLDYYLPFKTLVKQFEVNPNYGVEWSDWNPSIIFPSEIISNKKQKYDVDLTNLGLISLDDLVFEWTSTDDAEIENSSLKSPPILWETTGQKQLKVEINHKTENLTTKVLEENITVDVNIENIWSSWDPSISTYGSFTSGNEVAFAASPLPPSELDTNKIQYEWASSDANADIKNPYSRGAQITFFDSEEKKDVFLTIKYPELKNKDLKRENIAINPSSQQEWDNIQSSDFDISGPSSVYTDIGSTYNVVNVSSALSGTSLNENNLEYTFSSQNSNVANGQTTELKSKDIIWNDVGSNSVIVEINYNGLNGTKSVSKQVEISKDPSSVWENMLDSDVYIDSDEDNTIEVNLNIPHEFTAHVNLPSIIDSSDLEYEWKLGSGSWETPSSSNTKTYTFSNKETTSISVRVSHVNYDKKLIDTKTVRADYSENEKLSKWGAWNPIMKSVPSTGFNLQDTVDLTVDLSGFPSELEQSSLTYSWTPSDSGQYTIDSENNNQATITIDKTESFNVKCVVSTSESKIDGESKSVTKSIDVSLSSFNMTITDPGTIKVNDNTFTITGSLDDVNGDSSNTAINGKTIYANISQSGPTLNSSSTQTDSNGEFTFDIDINNYEGNIDLNFSIDSAQSEHTHTVTVETDPSYTMTAPSSVTVPLEKSKTIICKLDSYNGSSSNINTKQINVVHTNDSNVNANIPAISSSPITSSSGTFGITIDATNQTSPGSSTLELYPGNVSHNPQTINLNFAEILPHHKTITASELPGNLNYYRSLVVFIHPDNGKIFGFDDNDYMIVDVNGSNHKVGTDSNISNFELGDTSGNIINTYSGFFRGSNFGVVKNPSPIVYSHHNNTTNSHPLYIWDLNEAGLSQAKNSFTISSNDHHVLFTENHIITLPSDESSIRFHDTNFSNITSLSTGIDTNGRLTIDNSGEFLVVYSKHVNNNTGIVKILKITYNSSGYPDSITNFHTINGESDYSYFGSYSFISSNVNGDSNYRRLAVASYNETKIYDFSVYSSSSMTLVKTINESFYTFALSHDGTVFTGFNQTNYNFNKIAIYKD